MVAVGGLNFLAFMLYRRFRRYCYVIAHASTNKGIPKSLFFAAKSPQKTWCTHHGIDHFSSLSVLLFISFYRLLRLMYQRRNPTHFLVEANEIGRKGINQIIMKVVVTYKYCVVTCPLFVFVLPTHTNKAHSRASRKRKSMTCLSAVGDQLFLLHRRKIDRSTKKNEKKKLNCCHLDTTTRC